MVSSASQPPDRNSRAQCWAARDAYFGCLATNHHRQQLAPGRKTHYFVPGEEPEQLCASERQAYHAGCMKSWVDHFNKRVVNEQRSRATQAHPP
ncbi:hypothetical protein PTTG_29077 [Puccinia triticina 1-1 BBBD Race 1]|uniref:Uncharacterized protein n=1 Tax=Puccinia triticina (isolate 1-1 / race 1 (BBBD)) TaxID=630390 RepID=A0A180G6I3_PUCT1|nr:hypothetical protein PTTG_29077 [Puccinia triticina 1-1 BBBD Race 1]